MKRSAEAVSSSTASSSKTCNRRESVPQDWQTTKLSLTDCMEFMLDNQLSCDADFLVGPESNCEKISAHRLILEARSAVFQAMFSEKWAVDKPIVVPDVEPDAFKQMLRFLYTDKVALILDTTTSIIYAAKKYDVVSLEEKCIDFLSEQLSPANAFNILIQARFYSLERLVQACINVIARNTSKAWEADDFCNIDNETLCLVLKSSDLRMKEVDLFDAIIRWSNAACVRQNLSLSAENQRLVLKDALLSVRFPLMRPADFVLKVVKSGILTEAEINSVLMNFIVKSEAPVTIFSNKPRKSLLVVSRFTSLKRGGPYSTPQFHKIRFATSRDICLEGIGLYGSADQYNTYNVTISLKRTANHGAFNSVLEERYENCVCNSEDIFSVMLAEPFELTCQREYLLEVKIEGFYFLHGSGGKQMVMVQSDQGEMVTIQFKNQERLQYECDFGKVTDVSSGQIPELLLSELSAM